jgi:molybdopterin-containing oxidoreductase family membrane subunit
VLKSLLLVGSVAPIFWLHLLAGLVLPLGLIYTGSLVKLAGGLALLGVLAEKVWMLAAGQAQPWLDLPAGQYFPTWVEFLAVIGVVALAALLYFILLSRIEKA